MLPTTDTTQLQAAQACALAGKRLIRNDEWQLAAAGTPDPGNLDDGAVTCVTNSAGPVATGARPGCVSAWGLHDMVGNVWERVADWMDQGPGCTDWTTQFGPVGSDVCCFGGGRASTEPFERIPGAPVRGGEWDRGAGAGVFAIDAYRVPYDSAEDVGFRCAR